MTAKGTPAETREAERVIPENVRKLDPNDSQSLSDTATIHIQDEAVQRVLNAAPSQATTEVEEKGEPKKAA